MNIIGLKTKNGVIYGIQQAILNCEIPTDNADHLNVTIKLCQNQDMESNVITLTNTHDYQLMKIALDTQFIQLQEDDNLITSSYYTGTLVVKLTKQDIPSFNPNIPWYAVAIWSNGQLTSKSQMIQFLYSGFCKMPTTNF